MLGYFRAPIYKKNAKSVSFRAYHNFLGGCAKKIGRDDKPIT